MLAMRVYSWGRVVARTYADQVVSDEVFWGRNSNSILNILMTTMPQMVLAIIMKNGTSSSLFASRTVILVAQLHGPV